MEVDSDDSVPQRKAPAKGRGKITSAAKGKGKKPLFDDASQSEEEEEEEEEVVPAPKKRGAAASSAAAKKTPARAPARAPAKKAAAPARGGRGMAQSQLTFSKGGKSSKPIELSDSD
ncbi:hypothetical protein I317_06989 [Kwoniella heveanensis CBS 569]|uniref:Uncharacterized protein n=1 Tax=Kwoniella heveanensis BCC8398 TaxID=1296120 RepID=A0A1B9GQM6_9TREE|nr:hypothetical protein I316_04799 [Kwoniella heveanensis BCC8398]OCF39220.1 hypothetical protein I317_06989 [Kwoniella heveanensis CBS 569]